MAPGDRSCSSLAKGDERLVDPPSPIARRHLAAGHVWEPLSKAERAREENVVLQMDVQVQILFERFQSCH